MSLSQNIGKDAKNAFLTESPEEICQNSTIDTDIMFYLTSLVRNNYTTFFRMFFKGNINVSLSQEAIHYFYYVYPFMQYNVWDLDSNFTLKLPFRDFNFPFESNVSFDSINIDV